MILSHRENSQNQSYFAKKKQTTFCQLLQMLHSITAIQTPTIHTQIDTKNHTKLWWSSGYHDDMVVRWTRFNSRCPAIWFFFLQVLFAQIQNTYKTYIPRFKWQSTSSFDDQVDTMMSQCTGKLSSTCAVNKLFSLFSPYYSSTNCDYRVMT